MTVSRAVPQHGVCRTCGREIDGVRFEDEVGNIVDSHGYVEFDDGLVCHLCLGEGWSA